MHGGRLLPRVGRRLLASAKPVDKPASEVTTTSGGGEVEVKVWGQTLELPEVTREEAQEAFLDATSPARALTPPVAKAVEARDDMLNDRFNYVKTNMNPAAQYVVMGSKGAVAPAAVGQASFLMGTAVVALAGVVGVAYVVTQWDVRSGKELGDKLREKGEARRKALERSSSARLVRSISQHAEESVQQNVDMVRRPTQHMGQHLNESLKGMHATQPARTPKAPPGPPPPAS
jgi:hypothetical protein